MIQARNSTNYLGMTGTGINTGRLIIIFDENDIVKDFKVFQG